MLTFVQQSGKVLLSCFSDVSSCVYWVQPKKHQGGKWLEQVLPGTGALYIPCSAEVVDTKHHAVHPPALHPAILRKTLSFDVFLKRPLSEVRVFHLTHEADVIFAFLKMLVKMALMLIKTIWNSFRIVRMYITRSDQILTNILSWSALCVLHSYIKRDCKIF